MPENYYTVNDPTNPLAVAYRDIVRATHLFFEAQLPEDIEEIDAFVDDLARTTGESATRLRESVVLSMDILTRLPRLRALQHELFHLDLHRIITIGRLLWATKEEFLPAIDEEITAFLTPSRPGQILPTARKISLRLAAIIRTFDPEIDPRRQSLPSDFGFSSNDRGRVDLYASLPPATATILDEAVRTIADRDNLAFIDAFSTFIAEKTAVRVSINLYRATDLPDGPAWSGHWLGQAEESHLVKFLSHERDITNPQPTAAHDAGVALKAHVQGRDGTCRYPGCSVPAYRCQLDHRINHADGGSTSAENLVCLCQHHHNAKTDGRVSYLFDPLTGIIVWRLHKGRWCITTPDGPLSPEGVRWARTVASYRGSYHKARRAAA